MLSLRPVRRRQGRRRSREGRGDGRGAPSREISTILLASNRIRCVRTEGRWPRDESPRAVHWPFMEGMIMVLATENLLKLHRSVS